MHKNRPAAAGALRIVGENRARTGLHSATADRRSYAGVPRRSCLEDARRQAHDGGITTLDYQALSEFRYQIRRFLRFSERAARAAGLEPQQHQLLLAIKGMRDSNHVTVGELAERLQIQHHSTVELVDRLARRKFVQRKRSDTDRRQVLVSLTSKGEKVLLELSMHHRDELLSMGPVLVSALKKLMTTLKKSGDAGIRPARGRRSTR